MLLCPQCGSAYREQYRHCGRDGAELRPAEELDPRLGSQVGNYRLLDLLGKGGMGVVYKAEHLYIGKLAAIKILHDSYASHSDAVSRFLQEARAAATIGHANIVDVNDFGETPDGCAYFVMEYVEGRPLDQVIQDDGPLPLLRTINIGNQIGRALMAAHDKGIVHRDLKPENVMLDKRPGRREIVRTLRPGQYQVEKELEYDFVKLLDFGVAKIAGDPLRHSLPGLVLGTPEYMAPETARAEAHVDARVDIYAFGVLLYEMLTARAPFDVGSPADIVAAHLSRPVPPLRAKNPHAQVTRAIEQLIMKCLEKQPAARPQTMEQVLVAMHGCYGDEVYRRDADRLPGAAAAGIAPRPPSQPPAPSPAQPPQKPPPGSPQKVGRLTDELRELFGGPSGGGREVLHAVDQELAELKPKPPK
ncbi:MAG TPA: serine/threonine-protein kinase [Polyangia bacterium]|nr:serine/threonine-protein kinase [Polyangia bacterium]